VAEGHGGFRSERNPYIGTPHTAVIVSRTRERSKKKGPREAGLEFTMTDPGKRSGGLGVDLGKVVLRGLGTVVDKLADIFAGDFARDSNTSPAPRTISDWISTASFSELADASLSMPAKKASVS